jgi:hypothetical protein
MVKKTSFGKRTLIKTGAALILLVAVLHIALMLVAGPVKSFIGDKVRESSGGLYHLHIGKLSLSLLTASASAYDLVLKPDTARLYKEKTLYSASTDRISISGINLLSYLRGRRLSISGLRVENAQVIAYEGREQKEQPEHSSSLFGSKLKSVELGEVELRNCTLQRVRKGNDIQMSFSAALSVRNLFIDSAECARKKRLFLSDHFRLKVDNFRMPLPGMLYTCSIRSLVFSDYTLRLDSIRLLPRYDKYTFAHKAGKQIDRMVVSLPRLDLNAINPDSLHRKKLFARSFVLSNLFVEGFRDFRLPKVRKDLKMPQDLFREMAFRMKADTIHIRNMQIRYQEHRDLSVSPGVIVFSGINGRIYNLCNDSAALAREPLTRINLRGKLADKASMNVSLSLKISDRSNRHTGSGNMGSLNAVELNSMLEPITPLRIRSGVVHKAEFAFTADNRGSSGSIKLLYDNLKLGNSEKLARQPLGLKTLTALVRNRLVVKRSNPGKSGEEPCTGTIRMDKDPQKSLFNFWWKSLLTGIVSCVVRA